MANPLNLNPFGNTNTGILANINNATGLGVRPVTPTTTPPTNTLPPSQVQSRPPTTSSSSAPKTSTASSSAKGRNMTSISTSDIQRNLTSAGYDTKGVDNDYGVNTTAAVRAFQSANGLTPDGIFGPQTQAVYTTKFGGGSNANSNQSTSSNTNTPTPPPVVTPTTNTGSTQQPQYSPTDTGLYGKLVTDLANRSTQSGADYQAAIAEANRIGEEQSKLAADYAKKTRNIAGTAGFLTQESGLQGQLNNQYNTVQGALSSQASSANSRIAGANSQQGLLQSALATAGGMAAPQFPSYTSAQYNPTSNTYGTVGGGQYGSGPEAVSNITSRQQAQTGINDITQKAPAIDNQFSAAVNYAQQAGLTGGSPILTGFQNKFGSNFATNPAVIGFNQAINGLNTQLQALGEAPIDLNTATMTTIQQAQQTVKANLERKKASYQSYLNGDGSGASSGTTGSSGSTMFGNFFGN